MQDRINDLEEFMLDCPTKESFIQDKKTFNAVITSLTQIGENAWRIDKMYPDSLNLPYRDIAGMRVFLVHIYHNINPDIVWDTIHDQIPKLKKLIQEHYDHAKTI
jgi:uncharacterized protein with HEPN domain